MKRSQFGLLLFLLILLAFVPKDRDAIEKLISSLEKWSDTNPQEKVYLHTDKPNGVILINTRRGGSDNARYTPSIANISPKGFNKARLFYSPRYDQPNANMKLPDLRTTIYWNPILKTGENGKVKFDFFNADGPGTYKVVVEGINAAGELGRLVYRYRID